MSAAVAVVCFPGTNCEADVSEALELVGANPYLVWHTARSLGTADAVVLPGGFAHGDYLRPGAIARFSPVMEAVEGFAQAGGPVLGICNGFQVLTEAGLLPGALHKNQNLTFLCQMVSLRVQTERSVITSGLSKDLSLSIPINHFEGSYSADPVTLARLEDQDQVVLRYEVNPNGSVNDIAGVCNEEGNVVGIMPHPERAALEMSDSTDGRLLLESFVRAALELSLKR